jgi:hypothetical protein
MILRTANLKELTMLERSDGLMRGSREQKQIKRPPVIDGMDVEEFIRRNADPI